MNENAVDWRGSDRPSLEGRQGVAASGPQPCRAGGSTAALKCPSFHFSILSPSPPQPVHSGSELLVHTHSSSGMWLSCPVFLVQGQSLNVQIPIETWIWMEEKLGGKGVTWAEKGDGPIKFLHQNTGEAIVFH